MTLDEFIDRELGEARKSLLERRRQASTCLARMERALREGNLEQAEQLLSRLEVVLDRQRESAACLKEKIPAYDIISYLKEDFQVEFLAACREQELAVTGSWPAYEVFPFKVRIYPERRLIEINDRQVRILRPKALAAHLKVAKNRLYRNKFNPTAFLDALARVYDNMLAVRRASYRVDVQENMDVSLLDVYEHLTPLPSQRRAYPRNMFAFDLHRLFLADAFVASDGRRLILGAVKQRSRALLVYDAQGRDWRYGSMRFVREELDASEKKELQQRKELTCEPAGEEG